MLKSRVSLLFLCAALAGLPTLSYSADTPVQFVKDSTITADAKSHLLADPDIKSLHISVKTDKGVVTLSGAVNSDAQKMKAINTVAQLKGVKSINDKMVVKAKK